jgi:hypothetical protein
MLPRGARGVGHTGVCLSKEEDKGENLHIPPAFWEILGRFKTALKSILFGVWTVLKTRNFQNVVPTFYVTKIEQLIIITSTTFRVLNR